MDELERSAALSGGLVRRVQPHEDVGDDPRGDGRRGPPGARAQAREEQVQRLAVDVLHRQQQLALGHLHVEGGDDVGVGEARGDARLVEEHRHELRVVREPGLQPLHRDELGEARRAELAAQVHRGHASAPSTSWTSYCPMTRGVKEEPRCSSTADTIS